MSDESSELNPRARMNAISEQGLCSGCGLCESIAGADSIEVRRVANGYERPVIKRALRADTVDQIYKVCPGLSVHGLAEEATRGAELDAVWGPYHALLNAHAASAETRHEASTAGVLTALAQYLLESGEVSFILHTKASDAHPSFGEPCISETRDEVLMAAGSRYGPAAPLKMLHTALQRRQPFAYVGKPCDVAALRNLACSDERVRKYLKFCLAMVCGGTMVPAALSEFFENQAIDENEIIELRYRGKGCPGPTTIRTPTRRYDYHYLDFWGEDESAWRLPFRCKICADGIGEAADVVAADTWPGGSPDRETSLTDPGSNAVIARTSRGSKLVNDAVSAGFLTVERHIKPADLSDYQPHQVRKKLSAFDRHLGIADAGGLVPTSTRLRLRELAETQSKQERERQRAGTRLRVEQGYAAEETPA